MSEQLFKVVYEGDIIPGNNKPLVRKKLAQLFKIDEQRAERFFTGVTREVKRNVPVALAKKYVKALAKLGALSYMLPQEEVQAREEVNVPDSFTETGSFHVSELMPQQARENIDPDDKTEPDYLHDSDSDTTVPMDIVGAMSTDAFASFFERKITEQKAQDEETSGAYALLTDLGTEEEDEVSVVTDTKNVVDMRHLADLLRGHTH